MCVWSHNLEVFVSKQTLMLLLPLCQQQMKKKAWMKIFDIILTNNYLTSMKIDIKWEENKREKAIEIWKLWLKLSLYHVRFRIFSSNFFLFSFFFFIVFCSSVPWHLIKWINKWFFSKFHSNAILSPLFPTFFSRYIRLNSYSFIYPMFHKKRWPVQILKRKPKMYWVILKI